MAPAWHLQSRTLAMRGLWACACDLCLGMYAPCAWRVARESLGIHPRYLWPADAVRLAGEAGGGQRWRQVGEGVRWRASRGKPFTVRIAVREAPAVGTAPSGHHPRVSRAFGASTARAGTFRVVMPLQSVPSNKAKFTKNAKVLSSTARYLLAYVERHNLTASLGWCVRRGAVRCCTITSHHTSHHTWHVLGPSPRALSVVR